MAMRLRMTVPLFVLLLVTGRSLRATEVVPAAFSEVVAEAGVIVRGHVTDVRSVVVPGAGVDSIATVAVDDQMKGQPASFVYVRLPGGEIGRYRWVMVGAPRLEVGQQAVFFLKQYADGWWRPVGLTQGIYRVQVESRSGRPVINAPVALNYTADAGTVVRGDARRTAMSVPEFESLVRAVMTAPTGGAGNRTTPVRRADSPGRGGGR
jgi:hypothetical protein